MSGNVDALIEEQCKDVAAEFGMIHPAAQEVRGLCKQGVEFGLGETSLRSRFYRIIHFYSHIFVDSLLISSGKTRFQAETKRPDFRRRARIRKKRCQKRRPASRLGGQMCKVEIGPCRTFFSCTEESDVCLSGNARSMRGGVVVIRELPMKAGNIRKVVAAGLVPDRCRVLFQVLFFRTHPVAGTEPDRCKLTRNQHYDLFPFSLRIMAITPVSIRNSGGGLPLRAKASRAIWMPTPKCCA